MSTAILSFEVRHKLTEMDDVFSGIMDSMDSLFRIELDYCDCIPAGIKKRDQLLQKLKDGLWEANQIMGQIKP